MNRLNSFLPLKTILFFIFTAFNLWLNIQDNYTISIMIFLSHLPFFAIYGCWRSALAGPCCDPDRLPAGEARIYGEQVRFIPAHADLLLPQGFTWQGALLGRMAGGRLHMAPRLRCLLPAVPDPAHSLVLDDISDITALLSGQSRQTGLAGNEAALWWRDLPLARMMLKQGRATLSFN